MTIQEAVSDLSGKVTAVSAGAVIKTMVISDEEARISVYAAAGDLGAIQEATRDPALQLMMKEGLDVQVFVYDSATTQVPG